MVSDFERDGRPLMISSSTSGNSNLGHKIAFDVSSLTGGPNEDGKTGRPIWLELAHEMAHAYDIFVNGNTNQSDPWFKMSDGTQVYQGEKFATHIENLIRGEAGFPLRTHYAIEGGKPKGSLLIPGTRQSKFFSANPTQPIQPDNFKFAPHGPYKY